MPSKTLERHTQQFENISIYKTTENILVNAFNSMSQMNKKFKYIIGQKICEECLGLSETVAAAYNESKINKKTVLIKQIIRKVNKILILHRVLHRLSAIDTKTYIDQVDMCITVTKQAMGWLRSTLENNS